jgi:hypothetical protein
MSGIGPPLAAYLANRDRFLAVESQVSHPSIYSFTLSRFVFTVGSRAQTLRMVTGKIFPHPRLMPSADLSADALRQQFQNATAVFHPAGVNPPIHTLKIPKGKEILYFDAGGCFFPNEEPFKHFGRFNSIRFLSLRNCGLTSFPEELATLPDRTHFLDLSLNYIGLLPPKLQWKLFGLNLSENAFGEWPIALTPELHLKLSFLSLSGNPLQTCPAWAAGFTNLRYLDLSHTKLSALPPWLETCDNLKTLRLSGSVLIKDANIERFAKLPNCRFLDITGLRLPDGEGPLDPGKHCKLFIMRGLPKERAPSGRCSAIVD